jgi:hypothetical protein
MSVKIALLKSGETVISDMKELLSDSTENESSKVIAYLLNKPHKIFIQKEIFLSEDMQKSSNDQREVQVVLTDWIPLSDDDDIVIPVDWVVTVVDPINDAKQIYEEKING